MKSRIRALPDFSKRGTTSTRTNLVTNWGPASSATMMPVKPPMLAPIASGERMHTLDVVRGFALLGIFLMNIEGMAGPLMASMTGLDPQLTGADRGVDGAIYLLVQGKFYPLFSLLFGMGFAVMLMRAEDAQRPFFALYLRQFNCVELNFTHYTLPAAATIGALAGRFLPRTKLPPSPLMRSTALTSLCAV